MAGGLFAIVFFLMYIALLVVFIMGYWKTFTKAGQPGWACIVPIYNILVMADIAKVKRTRAWQAMGIGIVGYVIYMYMIFSNQGDMEALFIGFAIMMATAIIVMVLLFPIYKGIALNFGQSVGFAWGLMFLNVIFFAILGFGNARYLPDNNFTNDDILDADI